MVGDRGEGAVLGVNVGRPIETNRDFVVYSSSQITLGGLVSIHSGSFDSNNQLFCGSYGTFCHLHWHS